MEPDYSKYSLAELHQAKNSIDRANYPERAKEIDLQIKNYSLRESAETETKASIEELKYNTFWPRFFAIIIDSIILSVLIWICFSFILKPENYSDTFFQAIDDFIFVVYSILMHSLCSGQTLGKMITGVQIVTFEDEANISYKHAIMRDIVPLTLMLFAYVSILFNLSEQTSNSILFIVAISIIIWYLLEIVTMLFNQKHRALHDFVANTVVVRTNH
ncbi:RDD family protein [Kangiella sp. TOML190]|uniref:RDD family protein n=1 Tax=Kangiella sp. TOML190 TaxID=2931351 RepID=UPI00204203CE|nr:RDD family protein [Kangiella sp. TOML190]